jgi:uncharacterized protein (TIGR02996 family)
MTDRAALLRGVVADPTDDLVRHVFADWLEEHDEADLAEFIRKQLQLSEMDPWDEGYTSLDVRCRQLRRAHPEWVNAPETFTSKVERFCGQRDEPFERGFLARVKLTPTQLAKQRKLFAEHPITRVQFSLDGRTGTSWLKQPALTRLTGVELSLVRDLAGLADMLRCLERVQPLDHFGLLGCVAEDSSMEAVFASPAVAGVRSLWIGGTRLSATAERTFAAAKWPNLRRLVRLWITTLEWLRAPWVKQLRELRVADTEPNLNPTERRLLSDILPETDIQRLDLGWWELDEPGGRALGEAITRSRVRSLALAQTHTRATVARELLTPEVLACLRALYLSWANLDAATVGRLAGTGLRVCALDHMNSDALRGLEAKPGFPDLEDLRLGIVATQATPSAGDALRAALEVGSLPRLTSLSIYETTPHRRIGLGDTIARAVASSPAASSLRSLQLGEGISQAGVLALVNSPHLAQLQVLDVRVPLQDAESERLLVERFGSGTNFGIVSIEF